MLTFETPQRLAEVMVDVHGHHGALRQLLRLIDKCEQRRLVAVEDFYLDAVETVRQLRKQRQLAA